MERRRQRRTQFLIFGFRSEALRLQTQKCTYANAAAYLLPHCLDAVCRRVFKRLLDSSRKTRAHEAICHSQTSRAKLLSSRRRCDMKRLATFARRCEMRAELRQASFRLANCMPPNCFLLEQHARRLLYSCVQNIGANFSCDGACNFYSN